MKAIPLLADPTKFALVDDEDYEQLSKFDWTLNDAGYAVRSYWNEERKTRTIRMHRVILSARKGQHIDHADNNRLNNQKSNLRFADYLANSRNRLKGDRKVHSVFKGVVRRVLKSGTVVWRASIGIGNRTNRSIGFFSTEIQAALAYDYCARALFGDFARLNTYPEGLAI